MKGLYRLTHREVEHYFLVAMSASLHDDNTAVTPRLGQAFHFFPSSKSDATFDFLFKLCGENLSISTRKIEKNV